VDRLIRLNVFLDRLIEFRLYQPTEDDRPPGSLPTFREGRVLDYTVQRHEAKRAGLHRDVRIGSRSHGLFSWATRKDLPSEGGKIAIHEQPVHPHSYLGWEGDIPSGYGAGKVSTEHLGKALITKSSPDELHATLASKRGTHRVAFIRGPKGWLLARGQHPEPPPEAQKPKYRSLPIGQAKQAISDITPGTSVQPKVDGALVYVHLKNRPEILSHRKSKESGKNVVQTERFWGGRPTLDIPREHHGKALLAELYGERNKKAIEPQELGGILNANIGESLRRQKEGKVKLKLMPFDLAGSNSPYPERLAQVREIASHLPRSKITLPEEANTPSAAKRLFEKIRSGRHPLTKEGVVVHPPDSPGLKIKNVEEANVRIHSLFPGKGKYKDSHGGFYYADDKGNPLGKVGTGFTDQTRKDLPNYVGRTARVRYQERYKSGRLRAPAFVGVDESK
jgi:hypothetical protein